MKRKTFAQVKVGRGNILRETAKAMLFDFGGREVWMPKSQITISGLDDYDSLGTLTMPIWLAKAKDLWGYDSFGNPICQLVEA